MTSEKLIPNELLAFIQHTIGTMDEVSILQICKTNFKVEEISLAKIFLYKTLGKVDRMPTRMRDDEGEESLQDIITLLKETNPDDVPKAKQLHRLPPTLDDIDVPRLVKDITSLKSSLAEVQNRLETAETTISDLYVEVASLRSALLKKSTHAALNLNLRHGVQNAGVGNASPLIVTAPESPCDAPSPATHQCASPPVTSRVSMSTSECGATIAAAAAIPQPKQTSTPKASGSQKPIRETSPVPGLLKPKRKKKPAHRNKHVTAPLGPNHLLRPAAQRHCCNLL